jgi:hypothetical protein
MARFLPVLIAHPAYRLENKNTKVFADGCGFAAGYCPG